MAFHELATNATKHGSLASANGAIRIDWEINRAAPAPEFVLAWEESGGTPLKPVTASGFGTKVLLELVPAALAGRSSRHLTAEGLVWTLTAPLANIGEPSGG